MLLILFGITIAIIAYLVHKRKMTMSILERNGIPGPKPHLIYGNLFDYMGKPSVPVQNAWIKKYGKVMGFYLGNKPSVLVADPDLAKNIQIKDFQYFTDRPRNPIKHGIHPIPASAGMLIQNRGKRWKEMRSALTPTFSGSKLKTMTPIIDDSINNFIDIVDKHSKSNDEFDVYDMFQNLTTDVIGRTSFGIQSNVQNESNNRFLNAAKAMFNIKLSGRYLLFAIRCFPQLDLFFYPFRRLQEIVLQRLGLSYNSVLYEMAKDIIQLRKQNPNLRRKDLLQLMLDTKISGEEMSSMTDDKLIATNDENEPKMKTNGHNGAQNSIKTSSKNKKDISLTDDEIQANCVLFYEAGYETTSTALGFIGHILVNYPEVQEKIREEVKELYESEGKLDINTVNKLEYMERVLNETMRIYPPVITFISRECLKDYKYKDMTIPKGATVQFPVYFMHHDPDYWPEPEKFDPDRFSPERKHEIHPSSWQPFGSGPRNCIGMRFALFEAKLSLAKLLIKYKIVPGPNTEIGELTTECKIVTRTPIKGVYVKAVKL